MIIRERPLVEDQFVEIKFRNFHINGRPIEFEQVIYGFLDKVHQKEVANGKWQIDSIDITQIVDLEDYYANGSKYQIVQISLLTEGSFAIRPILKVVRK